MTLSIFVFGSVVLLSATAIAVGVICLVILQQHCRSHRQDMQRLFEQMDFICTDMVMLSERLTSDAGSSATTAETKTVLDLNVTPLTTASAPRAYEMAARLARGGASCEELMRACGLSRHEASLLLRLQSNKDEKAVDKPVIKDQVRPRLSLAV